MSTKERLRTIWQKLRAALKPNYTRLEERFINDNRAAMLTKTLPFAHIIIYTILVVFFILLIWAYFSEIDQITVSPGKVIPSSQVKLIQSLDGGIVNKIAIREGEHVKKNQPLIFLDDVRYKSDYNSAYSKYLALSAIVARLKAEVLNESTVQYPAVLNKYPELKNFETKLFIERRQALKASQMVQQKSLDLAKKEAATYAPLVEQGYASKLDYYRAQRNANDIQTHMMDEKDKFMEETLTNLNAKQADLQVVTDQLIALKDRIERATIVSPVAGIVKQLEVVTVGGVIKPGETIMQIVPIEDHLLFEAHIAPQDIGFIKIGQKATVKISAYDFSIYGGLNGTVTYISPDAIQGDLGPSGQRINYYIVNVKTDRNFLGGGNHKLQIMPGMDGTVHIETGKNTVLSYILKPLIKAQQEALREK